jgi:hypothetical protein
MSSLLNDPALTAATIVALSMGPLPAQPDIALELAAHVCRVSHGRLEEIGGSAYVRIPAAGTSEGEIARRSGLSVRQVAGMSAAAIALAYLNLHLTRPPYVLAVHQAPRFAEVLDQHRDYCPALAAADLIDTAQWADRLHSIPPAIPLTACARTLQVHEALNEGAASAAARLTAAVFARLAADDEGVSSLAEIVGAVGRPAILQAVAA